MSSRNKSLLTFIQEKMKEYEQLHPDMGSTHRNFILLGVEFDNENFPEIVMNRAVNNYSTHIAGLDILRDMIEEDYDKLKEKLAAARDRGKNLTPSGATSPLSAEQLMQSLREKLLRMSTQPKVEKEADKAKTDEEKKTDEILDQLKQQFGFDGDSTNLNDGRFSIQSSNPDDNDDDDD